MIIDEPTSVEFILPVAFPFVQSPDTGFFLRLWLAGHTQIVWSLLHLLPIGPIHISDLVCWSISHNTHLDTNKLSYRINQAGFFNETSSLLSNGGYLRMFEISLAWVIGLDPDSRDGSAYSTIPCACGM